MFSLAHEQLRLPELISQIGDMPRHKPDGFLKLLGDHIDLPTLIPKRFYDVYYSSETNRRSYSLVSMVAIVLLVHLLKISCVSDFVVMLNFAPELKAFCKLKPDDRLDASLISKFKITFEKELGLFFDSLTLKVIDIFDEYDAGLPDAAPDKGLSNTLIYDSTGLKPKVRENNPKTLEAEIKRQSKTKKFLESQGKGENLNVYAAAFNKMPKHARANEAIRLGYANGHFGYFYKFGLVTNGFGIPLHIRFLDKIFYTGLPNDFKTPEEQKFAYDSASLRPVLSSFYAQTNKRFDTFIGDSEFDSFDNYGLLSKLGFSKILIPINSRNTPVSNGPIPRDAENIPCCPKDHTKRFICQGPCKGKNRSLRFKYICPKSKRVDTKWSSGCENKCRPTKSTVTTYTYPSDDLRIYPGVLRGSREWHTLYKRRTAVERTVSSMKSHAAIERPNTYNCATMRADVYLNASAKLIVVMLAFALGKPSYMRDLKKLLKVA